MSTKEISEYYDASELRKTREDLVYAASIVNTQKTAIDCDCGGGSDIAYLLNMGFTVHAFDVEDESISRCKKRFKNGENIFLSQDRFDSFKYPQVSCLLRWPSLRRTK